ncbi:hypothetical protein COU78_00600 [Candidatus Peregrinibacteria bacterium CG10_big_fil_rev_8_21_14_0_10_49_24]|nr:MAG: hypothetical protein COV83_04740 [Candidatus Peregrinibacteria bacterium CG11_big_fil_rev_8_21_14_0_20_49_14]PIR51565.1 MAG: hypothetical protein COU78_00600 [Candidatus Peregrinibacteria bacterium CG10_big_fil_rev_8_21_14_0_10_49_24]PJA67953.1 MAG: hypothetical protein CO157_01355 [Candidatus Peregrinibacteria bacterium CG_4_9_14_3_um_filter_49_12]
MPQGWRNASDNVPDLVGVQFIHQQLYTNSHWYSIIGVHTKIIVVKQDVVSNLGKHIRILRRKHKLTQEELAGRSHISLKYVQNLEGKTPQNPSLVILQKLADGFGIPLWKLLKFED